MVATLLQILSWLVAAIVTFAIVVVVLGAAGYLLALFLHFQGKFIHELDA